MSVSNQDVGQNYECNGATTTFAIPFDFRENSQVKVYLFNIVTNDPKVELVYTTDFTIVGVNVETVATYSADFVLRVQRFTPRVQSTEYIPESAFPAEAHETALDKIVMMIQEIGDDSLAAVKLSPVDIQAGMTPELPPVEALGLLRVNQDRDAFEFLTIEAILDEAGVTAQIDQASADAAAAAASAAAAEASAAAAEADADAAAVSAAEAAADAAAAVGASVSNRIQVIPYCPAFMGGVIDEEYDVEVVKLDIGNRVMAFTKMSQYFITGRPIKVGFAAYTPTNNLTSKYKLQMTATLVKDGVEVSSVVDQEVIAEETTVSAVASALKVFSFEISPIGTINGVEVDANDGIKLEFKRIDASSNEDVELTRLLKQTFELSFA